MGIPTSGLNSILFIRSPDHWSARVSQAFDSKNQSFPTFQQSIGLSDLFRRLDEFLRRDRVERKHLIMAWNHYTCVNLLAKLHGFFGVEVPRYTAARVAPVDGEKGEVNTPTSQPSRQTVIGDAIATVIDRPFASLHDQTDITMIAMLVPLKHFVCRGDSIKGKWINSNRVPIRADGSPSFGGNPQAFRREIDVGARDDHRQVWIRLQ